MKNLGQFFIDSGLIIRRIYMKHFVLLIMLVAFVSLLASGCGETMTGVTKDVKRQAKGVKTIFIRDDQ